MNNKLLFAIGLTLPILMGSCSDSFNAGNAAGEGRVLLRPSVSTDIKVSRAMADDEIQQLSESCQIWISSEKGLVRKYDGIKSVPAEGIKLIGGQYTAEAWAGDSVPASFDARYFKAVEPFSVTAGGTTQVDLKCTLANTVVSVKYGEKVDDALSDYTLTVGHSCGKLTWEGRDERRGYFMMNSRDKDLTYTLTGKRQDGSEYTLEGKIEAVKPATEYVLNVNYEGVDVETGGAYFSIEIDESTVDVTDEIVIIAAPTIVALYGQELDKPVYGEAHKLTRQGFYIAAATQLKSVLVSAPSMTTEIGVNGGEFDVVRAEESVLSALEANGVKITRNYNAEQDIDNVKLTFEEELLNQLTDGTYEITVKASVEVPVDEGKLIEKTNEVKMTIIISDADIETVPMEANDPTLWSTEATLTGKVLRDGVDNVGFNYREKGTQDWTYVEGSAASRAATFAKGDIYTATITGLTPASTYEYVAVAGGIASTVVCEFTTDAEAQLPNAGFEEWQDSSAPYLIYAPGGEMFWDSGNHGSKTMGKNVTVPESGIKHSGERSIKLASQFVGVGSLGKFAAGNVFVGEYLYTDGTDGILGWGRPFTSRPKALKGYARYEPVAVTDVDNDNPLDGLAKGDMDRGIIYIALLDATINTTTSSKGTTYSAPVVVNTKKENKKPKALFNKDASNVIAYGKFSFTGKTEGSGMVEFTVPLEYYRTDVKPSYIICTASASEGGDYFTGGSGSVLYLDDLELVY